jgi:crossover junction endodeoxyribonuclease RusA
MRPVSLSLPFPVPLHACFIKSKGGTGIPSKRYEAYRAEFEAAWRSQGSPRIAGPVTVEISLCAPNATKRDADNLFKCLFDNMTRCGVIEDDNNHVVLSASWVWVPTGPACRVTVRPVALTPFDAVHIPLVGKIS